MTDLLHCYTSTYNDLYMIQMYVRHWGRDASKLFVYDDDSTDGTRQFLETCAPLVEIRHPGFHGIDEILLQEMRNREYKRSRGVADWVVIGDSDEFHYHPNMVKALEEKKRQKYQVIVSHGFNMFSDSRPGNGCQLTDVVKYGLIDPAYDRVIFDPEVDGEIWIGHHGFTLKDGPALDFTHRRDFKKRIARLEREQFITRTYKIEEHDENFKMLHYRFLGRDHIKERSDRVWSRSSERNKRHRWGWHLDLRNPDRYGLEWFDKRYPKRQRIID